MKHEAICFESRTPRMDAYWAIEPKALFPEMFRDNANMAIQAARKPEPADSRYPVRNGVAVIDISGTMTKSLTFFQMIFGGRTMPDMERQIREATSDNAVNAIMLRIDSPGGTVAGTSDLADAVFAARKRKQVTAYISDLGASAAYYVASQADRIYADADAMVGSIGVYLVIPDYSKMAEADGVKINVVRAGEMKGAGTFGTEVTDKQLAEFQREVDQLNEVFVETVARGRGWSTSKTRALNDGRLHIGQHALKAGLIDGIRSFDEAMGESMAQSLGQSPAPYSWRQNAEQPDI